MVPQIGRARFRAGHEHLGEMYLGGFGVAADPGQAFRWHLRAAESGNPAGAINVAIDYRAGFGTPVDKAEAAKWEEVDPSKGNAADLDEPTFQRTLVHGSEMPGDKRALGPVDIHRIQTRKPAMATKEA